VKHKLISIYPHFLFSLCHPKSFYPDKGRGSKDPGFLNGGLLTSQEETWILRWNTLNDTRSFRFILFLILFFFLFPLHSLGQKDRKKEVSQNDGPPPRFYLIYHHPWKQDSHFTKYALVWEIFFCPKISLRSILSQGVVF